MKDISYQILSTMTYSLNNAAPFSETWTYESCKNLNKYKFPLESIRKNTLLAF